MDFNKLKEFLSNYIDFNVKFEISITLSEKILEKRIYKYPHDLFHLKAKIKDNTVVFTPSLNEEPIPIKDFLKNFNDYSSVKVLINNENMKNLYSLTDYPIFKIEFNDVGYSDNIVSIIFNV